ncbi:hypothetical protein D3C75_1038900 [compost metagenome]
MSLQLHLECCDPFLNSAPVQLKLGFPGPAILQSSSAALSAEGFAHPGQPGEHVLELSHLHLELGLLGFGALGKYIQNQHGPVNDLTVQRRFQIADLGRGKLIIKNNNRCLQRL